MIELEEAHEDYEARRKIIIERLEDIIKHNDVNIYDLWLRQAIEFIKEKEI